MIFNWCVVLNLKSNQPFAPGLASNSSNRASFRAAIGIHRATCSAWAIGPLVDVNKETHNNTSSARNRMCPIYTHIVYIYIYICAYKYTYTQALLIVAQCKLYYIQHVLPQPLYHESKQTCVNGVTHSDCSILAYITRSHISQSRIPAPTSPTHLLGSRKRTWEFPIPCNCKMQQGRNSTHIKPAESHCHIFKQIIIHPDSSWSFHTNSS